AVVSAIDHLGIGVPQLRCYPPGGFSQLQHERGERVPCLVQRARAELRSPKRWPPDTLTRPAPPMSSASPVRIAPLTSRLTESSVCPGLAMISIVWLPRVNRSPSRSG